MQYNPDIHHRRSIRLKGYDYAQAGAYFVTLCLHGGWLKKDGMTSAENRLLLGNIVGGQMLLNDYGTIVQKRWEFLKNYHEQVNLDEFVVMPNHFHGIVVLNDQNKVSLSKLIRQFKTYSAIQINQLRKMKGVPVWKRDYYEHVIRNEKDLTRIREYIMNNPAKWSDDTFYIA